MFEGSLVALITPMTPDGVLDETALRHLVNWQIEQGSDGLVPAGTTGESPVLSAEEHRLVVRIVVEEAGGRVPVIAGCGSNNTREALEFQAYAQHCGADAALHVTGYYNRPSQQGIYQHFKSLSDSNDLPIIVYNIPPRTTVDITADTMARLASLPTIIGVKDATRDLARPGIEQMKIDGHFCYLSGEDATAVAYNAAGGHGCISVTANVVPAWCKRLQQACLDNDYQTAMTIQRQLMPLHDALFREPSPAGIKYACARLGLCEETLRLPLIGLEEDSKALIDTALQILDTE